MHCENLCMPAEWEPHAAMWIAWPHDEISFPNLPKVKEAILQIIRAISPFEKVELLILDDAMLQEAKEKLRDSGIELTQISFRQTDYMNAWMRDCAPLFVKNNQGQLLLTKWIFNAWGNKFPDLLKDQNVPDAVQQWLNLEMINIPLVLEGGAIDVNGQGVCLTTEQCLLNVNRNPNKSKVEIEQYLSEYLGISKTIWLKEGLYNDHTDGHIDEIARFVNEDTIVCAYEENVDDVNYQILEQNYQQLKNASDINGKPFKVVKLPMPHVYYEPEKTFEEKTRAPASYTNFYIGNSVVLAAVFKDPNDQAALEILQLLFPKHKVIPIDCSEIIYGGGAIHCLTQQQSI